MRPNRAGIVVDDPDFASPGAGARLRAPGLGPAEAATMPDRTAPERFAVLTVVLVAAFALRVAASAGDLWLDEIWSLRMAEQVSSPLGVLTELHHDNNHPLNTLGMLLLGRQDRLALYRIPSVLAGMGAVGLAWWIGRRRGRGSAALAAGLVAISFPMVVYASEARGYAAAVFLALGAFLAMEFHLDRGGRRAAVAFAACSILGVLAHLTFLYAYMGAATWWVVRLGRRRVRARDALHSFALLHAVPLAFFALVYAVDVSRLASGGGHPESWTNALVRSFSLVLGGPAFGGIALAVGLVAIAAAGFAFLVLGREGSDRWVFFAVVLFAAPAVVHLAFPGDVAYARYFLIPLAFLLVLVADLLSHVGRLGVTGRRFVLAVVVIVAFGNTVHLARFLGDRRGSYEETARFLRAETRAEIVTVGGDHDFRNRTVLAFYAERLGPGKSIAYFDRDAWPTPSPEWFLAHRQDPDEPRPSHLTGPSGEAYDLVRVFPYGGLSGWDWYVYRRR